jgi:hypothetical protein
MSSSGKPSKTKGDLEFVVRDSILVRHASNQDGKSGD